MEVASMNGQVPEVPQEAKKLRVKSEFWAVVKAAEGSPRIIREHSKKLLEKSLEGYNASDVIWAFRGKVKPLTAQSKVSF